VTDADRAWFAEQFAALRADLARLGSGRGARDRADRDLIPAIARAVGDRPFSARELVNHARVDRTFAAALGPTDTETPRSVGKLLARLEGGAFGGFTLLRADADRDGIVWRVQVSRL
jgi:hypothetical protein